MQRVRAALPISKVCAPMRSLLVLLVLPAVLAVSTSEEEHVPAPTPKKVLIQPVHSNYFEAKNSSEVGETPSALQDSFQKQSEEVDENGYPTPRPHSAGLEVLIPNARTPRSIAEPEPIVIDVAAEEKAEDEDDIVDKLDFKHFKITPQEFHAMEDAAKYEEDSEEEAKKDVDEDSAESAERVQKVLDDIDSVYAGSRQGSNVEIREEIVDPIVGLKKLVITDKKTTPSSIEDSEILRIKRGASHYSQNTKVDAVGDEHISGVHQEAGGLSYNIDFGETAKASKPASISSPRGKRDFHTPHFSSESSSSSEEERPASIIRVDEQPRLDRLNSLLDDILRHRPAPLQDGAPPKVFEQPLEHVAQHVAIDPPASDDVVKSRGPQRSDRIREQLLIKPIEQVDNGFLFSINVSPLGLMLGLLCVLAVLLVRFAVRCARRQMPQGFEPQKDSDSAKTQISFS